MGSRIHPKSSRKSPSNGKETNAPPTRWRCHHNPRRQEKPEPVETCGCNTPYQRKRRHHQSCQAENSKEILERAVQHLYPLELTCSQLSSTLNPAALEFNVRPKRDAATAAAVRIQELSEQSEL